MNDVTRMPRRILIGALLALGTAQAHALDTWYFNPYGTGTDGLQISVSQLGVSGNGFVEQTITTDPYLPILPAVTFEEHGAYQVLGLEDTGTELTVVYEIGGGVALTGSGISGGLVSLYADTTPDFGSENGMFGADNGTLIAQFSVDAGSLSLIPRGASLSASLVPGSMAAGYFLDPYGNDLVDLSGVTLNVSVMSTVIDPTGTHVISEIACGFAGFEGSGCNGEAFERSPFDFYYSAVQDVGVASLTYNEGSPVSSVPEPASALMMLTGLLGIVAWRRTRS